MRQAWDLRPFAAVHLDTWSYKIQRNYMGLKIAVCMGSWGKFYTKRHKDQKTHLPFLK